MSAGRTALVTGASSGIGRATAAALARRGHRVIGTSRDPGAIALDANEAKGISAEKVAATIVAAIEAPRPKPLYAVGSNAPLAFALQRLAPRTAVERLVARRHGIDR